MTYERTPARQARIHSVLANRQKDLTLVLANIHDPHNVSAIYRSCDAFGVPRVHLYYTHTAFPNLGLKSSASARKWVESVRFSDAAALAASLRAEGRQILATGFGPSARRLMDCDLTRPTAIIFGNEHDGVDEELRTLADAEVYIPMLGMVQSLNVSVAAAVSLYEAWRQRQAKGMYDAPSYDPEEMAAYLAAWLDK
ncbi:MAG: TrmH family RNA methyltransferase [Desulfovibrionaceae bacterium]